MPIGADETPPTPPLRLTVEVEQETDGRWIADVVDLPGVMAYGATRAEALGNVEVLALRVIAERIEQGELHPIPVDISFAA